MLRLLSLNPEARMKNIQNKNSSTRNPLAILADFLLLSIEEGGDDGLKKN